MIDQQTEYVPFDPVTYHLCRSEAYLGKGTLEACRVQDGATRLAAPDGRGLAGDQAARLRLLRWQLELKLTEAER